MSDCDVVVAGGGPAGLTAALFAARHGRSTILLDPLGAGGAILNTERVEDFPGFPEGISGFELGPRLQQQALEAGVAFELAEATRVEPRAGEWAVVTDTRELVAGAVIVATGTRPQPLGVPRENEFVGKGLSNCASCDGPLYSGQVVAVCGGGDYALIEALELVGHGVQVVLLHPDGAFAGQETYSRRVLESPQIEVRHRTEVAEIAGDGRIEAVDVRELASGQTSSVEVAAVFVHVGRLPNTVWLEGVLALDESGHVPTDARLRTELAGLLAAGDVRAGAVGRVVTATADGALAASAAHGYLAERA